MGVLTYISSEYDDEKDEQIIYAVTKFGINSRSTLNRIAGRAAVETGVGQRTLVAAAYDKEGIDLVWNKGLGVVISPEEKFPDAQQIEYYSVPVRRSSEFLDITNIREDFVPRGKVGDLLLEGIDTFRPEEVLHVWKIPVEVGGKRR